MSKFQNSHLIFIEKFVKFCEANDIWYSVDSDTLLYLMTNYQKILMNNQFMIMMTWESYLRLKRLKPQNVIDSNNNKYLKSLNCFYITHDNKTIPLLSISHKKNILKTAIKIRIVVPTTIKLVKKFNNRWYYGIKKISGYATNISNAVNFLYHKPNDGFMWIDQRFKKINNNWAPTIEFATINVPFAHFEVAVIKNSDKLIKTWFEISPNHLQTINNQNLSSNEGYNAS